MNDGGYVKGFPTYTGTMIESNENVMNVSLLKDFINRTLMNEWGILGWTLFVSRDLVSSNKPQYS